MTKETFSDRIKSGDPTEDEPGDDAGNLDSFLSEAKAQVGTRFEMGAEASVRDDDPDAFDSSELVQWAAGRAGVTIRDGSWRQYQQLHGKKATVDVETALATPGALVFRFPDDISDDPTTWEGRPPGSHVAISLGDGTVLEATTGGVRIVEHGGRFTHGGSIPEITGTIDPLSEPDELESSEDQTPIDTVEEDESTDPDVVDEDWAEKALDLRKQALDKSQEAEVARSQLQEARTRGLALQESSDDAKDAVLRLDAEDPQDEAWSERMVEAKAVEKTALGRVTRFDDGFAVLEGEATSLADEAQSLRVQAAVTFTAALPGTSIKGTEIDGSLDGEDPGTLTGPVSPEQLRKWLAERNEWADQREEFAGGSLREAEIEEDLADSYFEITGEARARAAAERVGIEADRAQLDRLSVRKTEAEALEKRLSDEVEQETAQVNRLRELGNTADAAAASERLTVIMRREFQWSGQVSSINDRMEKTQSSIDQAEEDATDYDQLATEFEELAQRHQEKSDDWEGIGAEELGVIDRDDFVTDAIEDHFAHPRGQDIDSTFDLIDGLSGKDIHIEVDRDLATDSTDSTEVGSEESVTSADDDVPLASAGIPEVPLSDVEPLPILEEALEADELDLISESDEVVESPEPVEVAVLEEQPPESEFEDQLDVADALEDSLDDLLDDQA